MEQLLFCTLVKLESHIYSFAPFDDVTHSVIPHSTRGIFFPPKQAWFFEAVTLEGAKIRQRKILEAACFVRSVVALRTA